MRYINKIVLAMLLGVLFAGSLTELQADIKRDKETLKKLDAEQKERTYNRTYDVQFNTISNIEFPTSNYGLFGFDVENRVGGGVWPRGSSNQYIFGGGIWLGARKFPNQNRSYNVFDAVNPETGLVDTTFFVPDRAAMGKYCAVTYNPSNARSFMVPGNVIDGLGVDPNQRLKYRTYFSTDFDNDGIPFDATEGPNWPIWDTSDDPLDTLKYSRYFGFYVDDVNARNTNTYPRGPAYISGEDIFATFKDTDLTAHDLGVAAAGLGYPLYFQTEITIYSWGFGRYQDFIFVKYNFVNVSEFRRDGLPADTLYDCYMAPIMDVDVARKPFSAAGAANDRVRYYGSSPGEDSTYNMAFQWTDPDRGEGGFGFGYLGFDFLESPAVITRYEYDTIPNLAPNGDTISIRVDSFVLPRPENNMVRKDKPFYTNEEQLGLATFQNWNIAEDRDTDEERYNFLSEGVLETDDGPGDKRFMMVTGPFNMRPGDSVRVVVGICIANTTTGGEATGETEDIADLVALDEFMQDVYDNNFRAPLPPDQSRMVEPSVTGFDTIVNEDGSTEIIPTSRGLNNAAMIAWDETAELSEDLEERGLDFLGYRIYRARRTDLDTFNLSEIRPGGQPYPSGAGLLGWKQIAQFEMPLPFVKSSRKVGANDGVGFGFIDSLRIIGPYRDANGDVDRNKLRVMRIPRGGRLVTDAQQIAQNKPYVPELYAIDSVGNPWYNKFASMGPLRSTGSTVSDEDIISPINITERNLPIFTDALVGYIDLKPSVIRFNPLFFDITSFKISADSLSKLPSDGIEYYKIPSDSIIYTLGSNGERVYNPIDSFPEPSNGRFFDGYRVDSIPQVDGSFIVDSVFFIYERDLIEINTSEILAIYDLNSLKPEVELDTILRLDTIISGPGDTTIVSRIERVIPNQTGDFFITARFPVDDADVGDLMRYDNIDRINEALDTAYSAIQRGSAFGELNFPDFEGDSATIAEVIVPYMAEITNGRTFVDVGDDDRDFEIETDEDVSRTEKIINQMDYFYRVLAYDEGHTMTESGQKLNSGKQVTSPNVTRVVPRAAEVGERVSLRLIDKDTSLLGSLNNFDLFALDEDRLQQLYIGDTISVDFNPFYQLNSVRYTTGRQLDVTKEYGGYQQMITINNVSKDKELYSSDFYYEPQLGTLQNSTLLTENTFSIVLADTTVVETDVVTGDTVYTDDIGTPRSDQVIIRGGKFSTGNFRDQRSRYTQAWDQEAFGTLAFEFNYYLRQFGGLFRPDSLVEVISDDPVATRINGWDIATDGLDPDPRIINTTQIVGLDYSEGFTTTVPIPRNGNDTELTARTSVPFGVPVYSTFNNGPGTYRMRLVGPEKTMQLELQWGSESGIFTVPYHDVEIINETEYLRPINDGNDSTIVDLKRPMNHIELPVNVDVDYPGFTGEFDAEDIGINRPSPVNLYEAGRDPNEFIGNYNISSFGYVNMRGVDPNSFRLNRAFAIPSNPEEAIAADSSYTGVQGVYLKSGTSTNGEVIDFVNMINISGVNYYSDYANIGSINRVGSVIRPELSDLRDTISNDVLDPNNTSLYRANSTEDLGDGRTAYVGLRWYGNDLGDGDEVVFRQKGGVQGLPFAGASLTYVVEGGAPGDPMNPSGYTDEMLDEINVVPNPYYITHEAQRSPYDAKIFFNKLPPVCTIEIYTVTGDKVKVIEHNELNSDEAQESLDVWDLLTDSGLRVQSQSLVARITTPDGAETLKTFSLVVGSFRITSQ
ncbi:MAG: hypothetical protein Kapaf2KO_20440 [Candidatus Kapaibacteriales bacterium]